jgi:hypothetical protein
MEEHQKILKKKSVTLKGGFFGLMFMCTFSLVLICTIHPYICARLLSLTLYIC